MGKHHVERTGFALERMPGAYAAGKTKMRHPW